MGAKKKTTRTIHLGRVSKTKSDIELFPDPKKVFKKWDKSLAERVLPIVSFDLALGGGKGRGVFLYYDDPSIDFIEWKTDGERIITVGDEVRELQPLADPPNAAKISASLGGRYLALDTYEIKRTEPSELPPRGWPKFLEEELRGKGAKNALARPRFGEHYPCYVQGNALSDIDDLIDAELPTSFLELAPMYFYLSHDRREFIQQLQMT